MKKKKRAKRSIAKKNFIENKVAIQGIIFVVCVLLGVLLFAGRSLQAEVQENESRISELQQEYEKEQERTQEIEELQTYMQSEEYMEIYAKDKIGLIKENEIVFKESK